MANPVALQYKRIESLPIHTGALPKDSILLVVIGNQTYQWVVESVTDADIDELFGEVDPSGTVKLPFEFVTDPDIDALFKYEIIDSPDNDPPDIEDLLATVYDIDIMYDNDPSNNVEEADPDDPNSYPYDYDDLENADLATRPDVDKLFPEEVNELLASVYDIQTLSVDDNEPTSTDNEIINSTNSEVPTIEEELQNKELASNQDIDALFE